MDSQAGAGTDKDEPLQFLRVAEGVEQRYRSAHGMTTQDNVFVTAGGDEATNPFKITFNIVAGFAGRMPWKVNRFGVSEMPKLVIIGKAGTSSSMKENQFHLRAPY